jgi:hypothetical protein
MEEDEFERRLADLIWEAGLHAHVEEMLPIREVETFKQAGVLTMNKGLMVEVEDGTVFQVTIVMTQAAPEEDV